MAYAEKRGKTWRVRYKRPDGTWGSESGFPTKTAALAYGREQESRVRRGDWTDPKSAETRLTDFIDQYLEAVDAAPGTISKQESHIRCHILPRWGSWQLGDLVMAHMEIRAWTKELRAKYPSGTVASIFQTLTAIMDMAVEARLIPASPCRGITISTGGYETSRGLVATPVQVLRAAMRLHQLRHRTRRRGGLSEFVLCLMAFYAGTRWGELVGQTRDEYDQVNRAIWVVEPLKEIGGRLTKGGRPVGAPPERPRKRPARDGGTKTPASTRWIHLPDWLADLYEELMASHPGQFVFVGPRGGLMRRCNYVDVWRSAWDGDPDHADPALRWPILPGTTFHDSRHTLRTWMAEDGLPEVARAARLGHTLPGMANVYEHLTPAMIRRTLQCLTRRWHQSIRDLDPGERDLLIQLVPSLAGEVERAMARGRRGTKTISQISPTRLAARHTSSA